MERSDLDDNVFKEIGKTISEDSSLAIYVSQEGRLRYFNRAFIELFGYGKDELSRMDYLDLIYPDFRDLVVKQTEMALAGATTNLPDEFEIRALSKNGEPKRVQIRSRIIEYFGKPAILGIAANVTERKPAEELLKESEGRYRLLAENLSDVVWIVNKDTPNRVEYISPSVIQLLGYTVEEAMSKKIEEVFVTSSFETLMETLARLLPAENFEQNKPVTLELEMIRKDGKIVSVEVKYSVIKADGSHSSSILAVARDITDKKVLEAERSDIERKALAASRLEAIGEMAAGIAHEINNPLASVIGFSDLMLHRDLPETVRKDLEIINEGARRVELIVKRLSLFARQTRPLRKRIDINEIVENAISLKEYHLRTAGIEVETDLDPGLPVTLADGGQLGEVFLNIISNAETEMNLTHGRGKLQVRTGQREGNIQISFKDDGPGISAESMKKLFRPFFTTRPVGMGTGLGLSVCYGIISEHGGRIWAESEFGKGATFFIELPITRKREPKSELNLINTDLDKVSKGKVLVVDDEPTIRDYLSQVLKRWGHQVTVVEDGYEALARIKDSRYDVILTDIKMPSMNGIELYRRIKKIGDKKLETRVIFITGDVLEVKTVAFIYDNKVPLVTKPIELDDLNNKIKTILRSTKKHS
jgi:two-component system, NtrC family, sensor kinase